MTYENAWFNDRTAIAAPPIDCILDCSARGPVDDAVKYWVHHLQFDGPAWLIREHLRGYGAWDRSQLCDHQQNLQRLLRVWCSALAEQYGRDADAYPEHVDPSLYLMY